MKDNLHLTKGARILNLRGFKDVGNRRIVILNCMEHWTDEDEDGFINEETEDASFYLESNDIDKLISKLTDAKAYLNGG